MLYKKYLKTKNQAAIKYSEVSNTPSCALPHSKGKDIVDYKIYGNSTQETRSGKNLFSGFTKGIGINSSTGAEMTNAKYASSDYIPVNFNTNANYYFSGLGTEFIKFIAAYNANKEFLGRTGESTIATLKLQSSSFVSGTAQGTGDIAYVRVTTRSATGTIDDIDNLKVQIEVGSTATAYEQYGEMPSPNFPSEIISVGNLTTKNLFNKSSILIGERLGLDGNLVVDDNIPSETKNMFTSEYIETEANKILTFSANMYGYSHRLCYYDQDKIFISMNEIDTNTITIPDNVKYLRFNGYLSELEIFQIEEGSVETAYEPYHKYDMPISICGKNLFDKSISNQDGIKNETVLPNNKYGLNILPTNKICDILKPNTTYTISCEYECTEIPASDCAYVNSLLGFIIDISDKPNITITIDKKLSLGEIYQYNATFTTPSKFDSDSNYELLCYRNLYRNSDNETRTATVILRNLQIELGSNATGYEPYREPKISTSKNLYDMATALPKDGWVLQDDGSYYAENSGITKNKVLWENTEGYAGQLKIIYQFKYLKSSSDRSKGAHLVVNYTDDTHNEVFLVRNEWNANTWYSPDLGYTLTNSSKVVKSISWTYGTGSNSTWVKDIMVTKDLSVTEYEPYKGETKHIYLDEPLRKVGNYADYVDWKNQKVVRQVGTSTKNFKFYKYISDTKFLYLQATINDMLPKSISCMSNKIARFNTFPGGADTSRLLVSGRTFYYAVIAEESEQQDYVDKMQNVTIYYPLETPTEEPIDLPSLPTLKGNTTIDIHTSLRPSNIKVKYIRL